MSKSDFPSQSDNMRTIATYMPDGIGIELQEKAGQAEVVRMSVLPRKIHNPELQHLDPVEVYARLGIKVTGDADDLFYNVELPEGWQKRAEDHAMWSHLADEKQRQRVVVFYKAAFYDRKAHSFIERRFEYNELFDPVKEEYVRGMGIIKDGGTEILRVQVYVPEGEYSRRYIDKWGEGWLEEHYPNWRDPFAYWTD